MNKTDFLKLADAAAILKAKLLRNSVCEILDIPNEDENTTNQWPSVAVDGKIFVLDQVRNDNQLYDKEFVADAFDRVCRLERSGVTALNTVAVPDPMYQNGLPRAIDRTLSNYPDHPHKWMLKKHSYEHEIPVVGP